MWGLAEMGSQAGKRQTPPGCLSWECCWHPAPSAPSPALAFFTSSPAQSCSEHQTNTPCSSQGAPSMCGGLQGHKQHVPPAPAVHQHQILYREGLTRAGSHLPVQPGQQSPPCGTHHSRSRSGLTQQQALPLPLPRVAPPRVGCTKGGVALLLGRVTTTA